MASSKRGNPDQYLQKVGGTYYARVRVPRTLEGYVGQTHIRRSLQTGDRAEANRRKHAVVGRLKGELESLRRSPRKPEERGISFAEAREWRDDLLLAEAKDDDDLHTTVQALVIDKAEEIERLYGTEKAKRWYKAATTTTDTLSDLMDSWLNASDYKASTNAGHRKALAEVLGFLNDDHAIPSDVTRKVAISYLDTDLTKWTPALAHSTIRDRLVSLGGFWTYLASRDAVAPGINPWTGHKISKDRNKGRSPPKRAYTEAEIVRLIEGNVRVRRWSTYSY